MADPGKRRSPLRGAVIGLGNVAVHAHLPAWQRSEHFTIDAVVEPTPERADLARRLLPEARIYPDMDALLSENGVDFVDICTPPCFHAELVLSACNSGLHVFCEKPLSISTERLRDIERSAKRARCVVFTVNNWKYAPLWVKATELIRNHRIGKIRSIDMNVLRSINSGGGASDWRKCIEIAQGGILIDHGWHNLYLILSLLQEFPLSMSVKMESSSGGSGPGLEETVDLVMHFCDAKTRLHLTWQAPCRRNFGTIVGSKGKLLVNDDHLILDTEYSRPVRFDFPEALSAGSHHPEWMVPVVENFDREIEDAGYRGTNLSETRWCSHLIDLAYRSRRDADGVIGVCSPFSEGSDS